MTKVAELAALLSVKLNPTYELDEYELGERVALALDAPMQTFWALYEEELWTSELRNN